MSTGAIEAGWAVFVAESISADLDQDAKYALELAYHAGAAQALAMVGRRIGAGETASTLGPVLLAWADEIVARSEQIAQDVLGEGDLNGARGC
jgi:hypothetical protein